MLPVVNPVQNQSVQSTGDSPQEEYLFVPYWTLDSDVETAPFDNLIYFGVEGSKNGVNTGEAGYTALESFRKLSTGKKTYLTVRLVNKEINSEILKSESAQKKIIDDAIRIAKEYHFNGIVLDLEVQGLPFESLVSRISGFNRDFQKAARAQKLSFGTLIYGDVYYRVRPYDVKALGALADRVYVMAYDFSKSGGNPGPGFPLKGSGVYGYDFQTMVQDILAEVPIQKITIIFGMFGYDWPVDADGKSTGSGTAKTTLQAERFLTRCENDESCISTLDLESQETNIKYQQEDENRIIWFETENSVEKKKEYLNSLGIHSIGYWAYSFF